jgi:hypothetical protein
MVIELTRLAIGLLILVFHRPLADWIMPQERALLLLQQRGVSLPGALRAETAHNTYFLMGTFVVLFPLARIWLSLHAGGV